MFASSLKGPYSTWTSAAGKTYAVDWDNIFKTFGNNVTSDPNWIIKAMDAGFAYGGPRVQVNTIPPFNPAATATPTPPSSQQQSSQITTVVVPGQIVYGPPITINPGQSSGPSQIPTQNIQPLQPVNMPVNWMLYTNPQSQPVQPQGMPMSEFDFSALPKVRAHAQLGNLGDMNQDATQALEDAHSIIIDFATAASDFYNDAVAEGAPSNVISALQSSYNDARSLVTQHTALMNAFYSQTGVSGLWKDSGGTAGLGKLGQWQLLAPLLGAALRQVFWTSVWVYIASIVGKIADSFKSNTDAAQAKFKTTGEYYLAWKQAKDEGTTPPPPPDNMGSGGFGGDMTTTLLIVGSVVLAVTLLMKR